ncbi:restriction endonuclease subunit S [Kitasatospora sp. NPDC048540]|uniref:restriction endonuclease subunit S n=1 Tax=Kitasatospora sp. NPDC048540 TaxID=3155634 RepID=UPI003405B350
MADAIVDAVPSPWEATTLAEICERGGGNIQTGPFGSQLHASDYVPVGIPSVMPQDIGDNVIREDSIARISPSDAQRLSRYLLAEDDIVYSRRGDVERRALVRSEQNGWLCGTGCLRIRPGGGIYSPFLSYYLGHPEVRQWIVRHAVGATMPNLNTKILGAVPVVVPPAAEQRAIAELLGALDGKIRINERIASAADELRSASYEAALLEAPGEFSYQPLSGVAEFVNGRAFTKGATGTGRMVVRIAEINSGPGSSTVYNDIEVPGHHLAHPGDVLFAWSGSLTVARWYRREAIINQHIFKVIPRGNNPLWLAFELINLKLAEFRAIAADKATTMGHIQRRHLDEPVPTPSVAMLQKLDGQQRPLWARALEAERESLTLTALRDTLLPQLMSGKLRVRDAERIVEDTV